ncbi:response regulator transcription factor [Glycomyces algeriensis]|uniref:HTH luxR-type domain-containing protein n=1 Tax=Glycomyces algeriensis TaxID=256037 RepID=A0A9W6G9U3_9ACTN|nr:helix-turn-helix transcriptional regulator [Glycomyces algeriensis]MDA1365596.1 helix-turn-helix transcriptional regulator [Glycomyces algeriensis]MDR7351284.1 DNA-binding CsgD family transcriptional regulator [Glycomyces algeriensis]GLI43999.1 hypothetical protein GALLR39Z86_38490 [Glycomyces algeriensis]
MQRLVEDHAAPPGAADAEILAVLEHRRACEGPPWAHAADMSSLTSRECEIMLALGDCLSNAKIASTFFITERTARKHIASIFAKLGISSRSEAAVIASHRQGALRLKSGVSDTFEVLSDPQSLITSSTLERRKKMSISTMAIKPVVKAQVGAAQAVETMKEKLDSALVRYDAWYVVFLAVILALGVTILAGLSIWCVVYKGKRFTGSWNWSWTGVSINVQCV